MRIETKFNVGETVFAAEHDRLNRPLVLKLTIKSIQVFFRGTAIYEWYYFEENLAQFKADELHATESAALTKS